MLLFFNVRFTPLFVIIMMMLSSCSYIRYVKYIFSFSMGHEEVIYVIIIIIRRCMLTYVTLRHHDDVILLYTAT